MRSKDRIEGTSNEKNSNNNTPYVVGDGSICGWLRHRECYKNDNGIGGEAMTAYEAMLKSKEDAAGIIASFCMAVLDGISDRELPDPLRIKIAMLANTVLDSKVEEVKAYEN